MSDDDFTSGTGMSAQHAVYPRASFKVAPTDDGQKFNAIRIPLIPQACWRLNDPAFDFDSSFVLPTFQGEIARLAALLQANPGCPAAIFGHADPAGPADPAASDALNKTLSDRRAIAIYALLTRQPSMWEDLYSPAVDGDAWGTRAIQLMLQTLAHPVYDADGNRVPPDEPYYAGDADGEYGPETQGAVKQFQGDNGLAVDGDAGHDTRNLLFGKYMDALCTPAPAQDAPPASSPSPPASSNAPPAAQPAATPFPMQPTDFLGGAGAGPGDLPTQSLQGCSRFNPVVLLSNDDMNGDGDARNTADAPNRRVLMFLFPKGTTVNPAAAWPCPAVNAPPDGCKVAFWTDGDAQRQPGSELKLYRNTHDTMACRFYDRFARRSPCEKAQLSIIEFFVYPDGQDGSAANDTMNATWGDQLRLGWMTSGLVQNVSITNTATGETSDVTFATGTNDGVYSLGWAPLCVTLAATDENGVAEYQLSVQWTNGRTYDKCKVRITMQGQNRESTYTLAAIVNDDAAIAMGLGRRRDLATVAQT